MLHNSSNVMSRQKDEHDIPEYPLFTHDEIDRCSSRMIGLNYGMPKKFSGLRVSDEIEIVLHPAGHVAGAAALEVRHKHRGIFALSPGLIFRLRSLIRSSRRPPGGWSNARWVKNAVTKSIGWFAPSTIRLNAAGRFCSLCLRSVVCRKF